MRSMAPFNARAPDDDRVDTSPHDRLASFDALTSNACEASTCPALKRLNRNIDPHRENEGKR